MGIALMRFGVCQHARAEPISKRAPSAFGRVNTSETFMASATVAAQLKSGTRHPTQRFTRPLYNRDLSSRSATFRNRGSERHLRINDLGLGCRGESRIIAGRGTWAQGVAGSNPVAPTTFRICRSHIGHTVKSLECDLPAASSYAFRLRLVRAYVEGCCRLRSAKKRTETA